MGRAGGGGSGSHPATPAPAGAGFASGQAPASAGPRTLQRQSLRCWAVYRLYPGVSRGQYRVCAARTSACSRAGLWRECGKSRRQNPSGVGHAKEGLWALRADPMAHARAKIWRPRDRRRPKRGMVSLGSRLFSQPSLGTPGARGGVCFHAAPSSAHTLCPECRRDAPRGAAPEAPRGRGPSHRERPLPRGNRAGASASCCGASARAQRQRTAERGDEAGQEKRLEAIPSPSAPVGLAPLSPPCPCHDVADANRGQGLSHALAQRAPIAIWEARAALRI
jgi:hypothetical protein